MLETAFLIASFPHGVLEALQKAAPPPPNWLSRGAARRMFRSCAEIVRELITPRCLLQLHVTTNQTLGADLAFPF